MKPVNSKKQEETYEVEVRDVYEILKQVIVSPVSLYTKDPDLHDKVHEMIERLEYVLFNRQGGGDV